MRTQVEETKRKNLIFHMNFTKTEFRSTISLEGIEERDDRGGEKRTKISTQVGDHLGPRFLLVF